MYTYTLRLQVVTQESLLKPYGSNPIVTWWLGGPTTLSMLVLTFAEWIPVPKPSSTDAKSPSSPKVT